MADKKVLKGSAPAEFSMQEIYRPRRRFRLWPRALWARTIIMIGLISLFLSGLAYSVEQGTSRQLVNLLREQSFPFESLLLEGMPGYSQLERVRLDNMRRQGASIAMYLLTGVNIADARTFFLSYFAPPPQGPAWLGWAYKPDDPEFEGTLEPLPDSPNVVNPAPDPLPSPLPGGNKNPVLVGIFHTHNSESYAGDGGPDRQPGQNGDVVRVGEVLKNALQANGIGVVHSLTIHDNLDFMRAYSESVKTATKLLQDYPSIRILLDIHRDGLPAGVSKSTVRVNGKDVARVMIVIGKQNPHWQANESLAKQLIALGEKKYPGLFIPTITYAADARYNQHLSNGALLLEFGSQLNTLDEASGAAVAVADVLSEWLKK